MGAIFAPIPPAIRYDIYGNIETPLSQEDKTFGYNTLEYTPQNKLTYIRARYYDSSNGTFLSKDTYLGNIYKPSTTNRYAYCSGDPVNYMDLDGHRMVIYDDSHGGGVSFIPKPSQPSRPSTGGNKANTGGNVNQGGSSGNSSGGSSYVAPPPPPNPVEKYIKQSFLSIKATVSSAVDSVKSVISNTNKTIKSEITSNTKYKTTVLAKVTTNISNSAKEFVCNTLPNVVFDAFGSILESNKTKIRLLAGVYDLYKDGYTRFSNGISTLLNINDEEIESRYSNNTSVDENNKEKGKIGQNTYINGQATIDEHGNLYYGDYQLGSAGNIADNGCGIIAEYNTITTSGGYSDPADIIKYMDINYGFLLGGQAGVSPFAIDNYLRDNGYSASNIYLPDVNDLDELVKDNDSVILMYAWEKNWELGAHYIEIHYDEQTNEYVITNEFSNRDTPKRIESLSDYINSDKKYNNTIMLSATIRGK